MDGKHSVETSNTCCFCNNHHILIRQKHLNVWYKLKQEIIKFVEWCWNKYEVISTHYQTESILCQINKPTPFDIYLFWADDDNEIGMMFHDIANLFGISKIILSIL